MYHEKLKDNMEESCYAAAEHQIQQMDRLLRNALKRHGIDINWEEEKLKRFKSIQWETREGIHYFYYNNGSVEGELIIKIKIHNPTLSISEETK